MSFTEIVDAQLAASRVEAPGQVDSWEESFVRVADAFDAANHHAQVGHATEFIVALGSLSAEAERAFSDHNLYVPRTPRDLAAVELEQMRAARNRKIASADEARGHLRLAFERVAQHLIRGGGGSDLKTLLARLMATCARVVEDLGLEAEPPQGSDPKSRKGKKP